MRAAWLCALAVYGARQLPEQMERLALGPAPRAELRVDAPAGTLTLLHLPRPERTAARWKGLRSEICPDARVKNGALVLRCTTRRLEAELGEEGGRRVLVLRTVSGIPWQWRAPRVPLAPAALGEGSACPGDTPAARGECLLAEGEIDEARAAFLEGADGGGGLSQLRLGDLAWEDGAYANALGHYGRVPLHGPVSRLARARVCALTGRCTDSDSRTQSPFERGGLPPQAALDLRQHELRDLVFNGRLEEALSLLLADRVVCEASAILCLNLLEQGFSSSAPELRALALSLYFAGLRPEDPEEALHTAWKAAETSGELGAPATGAQLLSSLLDRVPKAKLEGHLLLTAQLYLDAKDPIRARVARDFAKAQPGPLKQTKRWRALERRLSAASRPQGSTPEKTKQTAASLDEAQQLLERSRKVAPE